jgi:hypothetical protein
MVKTEVIKYLRESVIVQDPSGTTAADPAYLSMTDEELERVLTVALSRDYPWTSINNITNDILYPVVILARKELYYRLASNTAPLYSIGFGDSSLRKNLRFDHYTKLINETNKEYQDYRNTGILVQSTDAVISSRYYSKRSFENQVPPVISANIDNVYQDSAEISWSVQGIKRFNSYIVLLDTAQIVDPYQEGGMAEEASLYSSSARMDTVSIGLINSFKVSDTSQRLTQIYNVHNTMFRVTGLTANTAYHVAVVVQEMNGLKSYSETTFSTLV